MTNNDYSGYSAEVNVQQTNFDQAYEIGKNKALTIWNNPTGRKTVSTILQNFDEIITNANAGKIITSISDNARQVLTDETGANSLKLIVDGIFNLSNNEQFSENLNTVLKNTKLAMANPEAVTFSKLGLDVIETLLHSKQAPALISAIGDGIIMLTNLKNPQNDIINGFRSLRQRTAVKGSRG